VKRHHDVPAVFPSRKADIPHDAHQAASGSENPIALGPNLFELLMEGLVILNMTKLIWMLAVLL